jgi:hypothetical protein
LTNQGAWGTCTSTKQWVQASTKRYKKRKTMSTAHSYQHYHRATLTVQIFDSSPLTFHSAPKMRNLLLSFALLALAMVTSVGATELDIAFYDFTCPDALAIVQRAVHTAMQDDARMPASLLRLHFHDCFVNVSKKLTTTANIQHTSQLENLHEFGHLH